MNKIRKYILRIRRFIIKKVMVYHSESSNNIIYLNEKWKSLMFFNKFSIRITKKEKSNHIYF